MLYNIYLTTDKGVRVALKIQASSPRQALHLAVTSGALPKWAWRMVDGQTAFGPLKIAHEKQLNCKVSSRVKSGPTQMELFK